MNHDEHKMEIATKRHQQLTNEVLEARITDLMLYGGISPDEKFERQQFIAAYQQELDRRQGKQQMRWTRVGVVAAIFAAVVGFVAAVAGVASCVQSRPGRIESDFRLPAE